jgi:hypothetical protein
VKSSICASIPSVNPIGKVVSGGQTGADRAGLDFAIKHGTSHGGGVRNTFIAEFGKIHSGISLAELVEMKVSFGAAIWAIMMRARQLGLISEAVFLRFCKVAAPWRSAKEEPGDERYQGNESHSRFRQLVQRAVAEDQISMSKGAALLHHDLGDFRKEMQGLFA